MWLNKIDVFVFVDGDGFVLIKYVYVVFNNCVMEIFYYVDIIVGFLFFDNVIVKWEFFEYFYMKQNGGKVCNFDVDFDCFYLEWFFKIGVFVVDIMFDFWNGMVMGLENDIFFIWGIDFFWQDDGEIICWDIFWNIFIGDFDDMIFFFFGFYFSSEVSGRDFSKWEFCGWLYNSVFYVIIEEFCVVYWFEDFVKNGFNVDGDWVRIDKNGEIFEMDKVQGFVIVVFVGVCFVVDYKEKYVEWMDWSFYVGFNCDIGFGFFDICYKGERFVYELFFQEVLVYYVGNDFMNFGIVYFDSFYGFGFYIFEFVKGYDCFVYVIYMNILFYVNEEICIYIDSFCLFEYVVDYLMQRYIILDYVLVIKNIYFVIRFIVIIGNYDYQQFFFFFMDGFFVVEVCVFGYIQSVYFVGNEDYGFKIYDNFSGFMYDYVFNFKVDFDVLGINNFIEFMSMVLVFRFYFWFVGKVCNIMVFECKFIEIEDEFCFNWGFNLVIQVLIVNENERNKYGEMCGYCVFFYMGIVYLIVQNSINLGVVVQWVNYDVQIIKYKDFEQKVYYVFNMQDVYDFFVNFDKYFDGEFVCNEDIVLWLNLGMYYVFYMGDFFNMVQIIVYLGIQFMLFNYFDIDQSRCIVNQVCINYFNGSVEVEEFGQFKVGSFEGICSICKFNYIFLEFEYQGYKGDVVICKFFFDFNNLFYVIFGI